MDTVIIHFELPEDQAMALAQFLKRVGYSAYRECAVDENEAYEMVYAADQLRQALARQGYAPR